MEKYKVCPNCGEHNDPRLIECQNCYTDLAAVKVVDEATENITYEPETQSPMVKICECGAENPPAARKCCSCDEDISDILPTPKVQNCCKQYVLAEVSGEYTYDVPNNSEIIIGRENVLKEFISNKSYVSRSHAKIVSPKKPNRSTTFFQIFDFYGCKPSKRERLKPFPFFFDHSGSTQMKSRRDFMPQGKVRIGHALHNGIRSNGAELVHIEID